MNSPSRSEKHENDPARFFEETLIKFQLPTTMQHDVELSKQVELLTAQHCPGIKVNEIRSNLRDIHVTVHIPTEVAEHQALLPFVLPVGIIPAFFGTPS